MAEVISKTQKATGFSFFSDFRKAGDADKARLRQQKASFKASQAQEQAESFKPVAAPVAAKRIAGGTTRAESLLTRVV